MCAYYIILLKIVFKNFGGSGKKMLVPLTASLYVPGTLDDSEKVLVDVGTGYFIEVSPKLLYSAWKI